MENSILPRVLIVCRSVWDDTQGTSSTLTNLFQNYDADKLAHIYIETKKPNTRCCKSFFQISEYSLVHKILHWKTKTGFYINTYTNDVVIADKKIAAQEENAMSFIRKNRSIFFTFLREFLWLLNGWRSKELKSFFTDFNPDVIFLDGSPLVLMNRINRFVLEVTKKPGVILLMDDNYSYKSCKGNYPYCVYKYFLRKSIKPLVDKCDKVFVYSPKMKKEYDGIFGIDSLLLTKGIDFSKISYKSYQVQKPIKLVYLGQVIYGRIYSLIAIAEALGKINANGVKMQLYIYTNNPITDDLKNKLVVKNSVFLMNPVPYSEVPNVIAESDVLLFVESFTKRYKNTARLSFSTKITDYLSSSKCILAIGPADIAPIEYFKKEDAAIVVTDINEIQSKLEYLCNQDVITEYSRKGFECARRNHDMIVVDNLLKSTLKNASKYSISNV